MMTKSEILFKLKGNSSHELTHNGQWSHLSDILPFGLLPGKITFVQAHSACDSDSVKESVCLIEFKNKLSLLIRSSV